MVDLRFQSLSADDRRDALLVAVASHGNYQGNLLEKDIWVVTAIRALFDAPFAEHLTFKGGTSLSKAWHAIHRFSEDVDVTYDIRAFASDLTADTGGEPLPPTRSQQKRWTRTIRSRLNDWVRDQAGPYMRQALAVDEIPATVRVEDYRLYIDYEPLFDATRLVQPEVIIEFGARSTGEPRKNVPVVCDAAEYLPKIIFPEACPAAMVPERTFWEKATAAHVFCLKKRLRGERQSRHWYDLVRLDEAGIIANAIADRKLALSVALHQSVFFFENDANGNKVDYEAAVSGHLQLVPVGQAYRTLEEDYARTQKDGFFLGQSEPFEELMERCAAIQARINDILA